MSCTSFIDIDNFPACFKQTCNYMYCQCSVNVMYVCWNCLTSCCLVFNGHCSDGQGEGYAFAMLNCFPTTSHLLFSFVCLFPPIFTPFYSFNIYTLPTTSHFQFARTKHVCLIIWLRSRQGDGLFLITASTFQTHFYFELCRPFDILTTKVFSLFH